jgi:hypothetical protein
MESIMVKLSSNQQKYLKSFHIVFGGIWLSSIIIMTAITILVRGLSDGGELYMLVAVYEFIDFKILTPAATGTLLTGLIYSMFTKWGFFKHGWLIYKWVATLGLVLIGTFYLGPMTEAMADIVNALRLGALENLDFQHKWNIALWAGFINSALLLIAVFFSTLKPWGNLKK